MFQIVFCFVQKAQTYGPAARSFGFGEQIIELVCGWWVGAVSLPHPSKPMINTPSTLPDSLLRLTWYFVPAGN